MFKFQIPLWVSFCYSSSHSDCETFMIASELYCFGCIIVTICLNCYTIIIIRHIIEYYLSILISSFTIRINGYSSTTYCIFTIIYSNG